MSLSKQTPSRRQVRFTTARPLEILAVLDNVAFHEIFWLGRPDSVEEP